MNELTVEEAKLKIPPGACKRCIALARKPSRHYQFSSEGNCPRCGIPKEKILWYREYRNRGWQHGFCWHYGKDNSIQV